MTIKILYNSIIILSIAGLLLPSFSFAQTAGLPETSEDVKALGEKALEVGEKEVPGMIKTMWQEQVLPIWQKMFNWVKTNIWPKFYSWFQKEVSPEIEKRKPLIEEEFEKEKEEVKAELPQVGNSLWEKFKQIIKKF